MRSYGEGQNLPRAYAQIVGVVLLLVGVAGLLLGDQRLAGVLNIDLLEDIVHLVTGGILAYVGFGTRDASLQRTVVGGLGVVYILVGVLGFITPTLFGLLPSGYSIVDNLFHLALGVISVAIAWLIGRETSSSTTATR